MPDRLVLREYQTAWGVSLEPWQVEALRRAVPDLAIVPSTLWPSLFDLTPAATIGTVELAGWPVDIRPKVALDRVLFLVSYALDPAAWQPSDVDYGAADTLVEAMAALFAGLTARALEPGVLHGYRTEDDALQTVRGRIRFGDQLRRRYGNRLPVEVTYDEFTDDITENRLLKAAIWRLRRFSVPASTAGRLRRSDHLLERVEHIPHIDPNSAITWSRLNARYRPAIALARLILQAGSLDIGDASHRADGLLLNMNRVFEEFVVVALRHAMRLDATQLVHQAAGRPLYLDAAKRVGLSPDLSWWAAGRCLLVGDAKYKRLTATGIKHPDLYQLLAYLVATGVAAGVLVYPLTEAAMVDHVVPGANVVLLTRTIDLSGQPVEIVAAVGRLAEELHDRVSGLGGAASTASSGSARAASPMLVAADLPWFAFP